MRIWTMTLRGNLATGQQALALAGALRQELGGAEIQSFYLRPPRPIEISGLISQMTWPDILSEVGLGEIGLTPPWPEIVIGCRPEVSAAVLGIKRASGGAAKIIQIQNPNGADGKYAFALTDFDLIIRQPQENFPGCDAGNVIASKMALRNLAVVKAQGRERRVIAERLRLKNPMMVMIGGSDEYMVLSEDHYRALGRDLAKLAERHDGTLMIFTSRRTSAEGKWALRQELFRHPRDTVLFDEERLGYGEALAVADRFIVTADSGSMVSEAIGAGRPCSLYDFGGLLRQHPLDPTFDRLIEEGAVARFPDWPDAAQLRPHDELPELAGLIRMRLFG